MFCYAEVSVDSVRVKAFKTINVLAVSKYSPCRMKEHFIFIPPITNYHAVL